MWQMRDASECLELERTMDLLRRHYAATMIQACMRRWLALKGEYVFV